ncbi:MAG: tetratricopeptide repeat protein [candidate division WOR-3 bacterium]|nr:MAG: tetratricopeptide repeat protein [candidate division WOR-3 bacterium]
MTKVKKKRLEKKSISPRSWNLLCAAILIVLTILLYLNSLGGDFVWDDRSLILQTPQIQHPERVLETFAQPLTVFGSNYGYYRPVAMMSLALDQWTWGGNPLGFHIMNLILHLGVVICLYFFFTGLVNWKIGFIASLLFATFACHVENVAFISGRMDILATLFMVLCLWLYFRKQNPSPFILAVCALFGLLALLSKEIAFVLPVVFVTVLIFFIPRQYWKKHISRGAIFIGMPLIVYAVLRLYAVRIVNPPVSDVFPLGERLLMIPQTTVLYLQLLIFPFNLNARHVILPPQYSGMSMFVIMLIVVIAVIALVVLAARRNKTIAFGAVWFCLGILPVLNIIPLRGQVIAERFLYFPSAGFALMLAGIAGIIHKQKKHTRKPLQIVIWVLLTAVGVSNLIFTVTRNPVWHNELRFFSRMVEQTPDSPLAHHNLGYVYYRQGNYIMAELEYRKAIELNPTFPDSRATLGDVLTCTGRYEQAVHQYRMYLNLYPDAPNRAKTLEVIEMLMEEIERESIEQFK